MSNYKKTRSYLVSRREYTLHGCLTCGGDVEGYLGGTYCNVAFTIYQLVKGTCSECKRYYSELYLTYNSKKDSTVVTQGFPLIISMDNEVLAEWRFGTPISYLADLKLRLAKYREEASKELASQRGKKQ